MDYIQGEGRSQGTLFPVVLDELVPADLMYKPSAADSEGAVHAGSEAWPGPPLV
jgi:hypothetical protein